MLLQAISAQIWREIGQANGDSRLRKTLQIKKKTLTLKVTVRKHLIFYYFEQPQDAV